MACFSTQLKNQINRMLEETCGFSEYNSPAKYNTYCKIRAELSRVMGVSRGIGIIEYEKAIIRLKDIQRQLEVSGKWE